jgi:hypothetical protein
MCDVMCLFRKWRSVLLQLSRSLPTSNENNNVSNTPQHHNTNAWNQQHQQTQPQHMNSRLQTLGWMRTVYATNVHVAVLL